jgi:S-adenosylmethionine hydrolase
MRPLITLLTDFGTADGYVAEMKGVILSHVPEAQMVDISHDIAPQDVEGARLAVARYWRRFPEGTVHIVVVDPGVGSARAAIAVASDGRFLVGPDNGALSPALLVAGARVVSLGIPAQAAPTFHGRDLFAPVAARLAAGAALAGQGRPAKQEPMKLQEAWAAKVGEAWRALALHCDRFGNVISNLPIRALARIKAVNGIRLRTVETYADAEPNELVALVGSSGRIEFALREGSAANRLHVAPGETLVVT